MSHDTMNCGFSEHSNREKKIDIQGILFLEKSGMALTHLVPGLPLSS